MTSYLKTMLSGIKHWVTAQKADWNQNDETAANYIKGRPCYETDPKMEYLIKDETVTLETAEGFPGDWALAELSSPISLEDGKTYTVTWDGKEYSVVGTAIKENVIIGNMLLAGGDDTGEPFLIAFVGDGFLVYGLGAGTHTFSVSTMGPRQIIPLPSKFLPDIPVEKLPEIPVEKLPEIPVEKLPEIPVEKLPTIPASKITGGVKTINGVGPDSNGDVVIAAYSSEDDLPVIPVNKLNNIYKNIDETVSVPFDLSNVDGLDKFNVAMYGEPLYVYKITDKLPNFSYVDSISIKIWLSSGEFTYKFSKNSTSAEMKLICDEYAMYSYGYEFIFASKAGDITFSTRFDTTVTFNIPSPGLYVAENALSLNYHIYSIRRGIYLNSSTDKKFLITVDDSGTISATEVTT